MRQRGFGSLVPTDIEEYRRGAGDMSNDPMRMIQLDPNSPNYQRHLFEIMARNLEILGSMRIINRGITTRMVTVTAQPTLIMNSTVPSAVTIINPTPAVGLTTSFEMYPAGTVFTNGNNQATPVGVANYDSMHLFINVTAVGGAGNINILAQTKDELTGNWVDVQDVVPAGINATGLYYGFFSGLGVCSNFALRWHDNGGGGSITASVGYTMKNGLGGTSAGADNTIFIGSAGVTRFGGYPILEGQYRDFNMRENVDLFGVSGGADVNINIIEFN